MLLLSPLEEEFVYVTVDINGLKTANDTLGHAAGDELLKGAASCLLSAIGAYGKVYRVGGDEFMAIVHTSDCEALLDEIRSKTAAWRGRMVDGVTIALGCASHAEYPDAGIEQLDKLADSRMYEDKDRFYQQSGQERRRT